MFSMATGATSIKKLGAVSMALLCAVGAFAGGALAQTDYHTSANSALNWVKTQQQPDGSFQGFGAGSTVDAILAIVAAGQDPMAFSNGGNTPLTFLQSKAADLAKTPGSAGKVLIALGAIKMQGQLGSVNMVDTVSNGYDASTGHYGKDVIGHAFAMLGLHAVGKEIPAKAIDFLRSTQTPEGGWAFSGDTTAGGSDTNTTAVVLQALVAAGAAGKEDAVVKKAISFLDSQQNTDGGFPYQKSDPQSSESDVNSTAYVSQAMYALGYYATADKANAFMAGLQKSNGAFQWKKSEPDDNPGATYQAIPALLHATLAAPAAPQNAGGNVSPAAGVPGMPTTGNPVDGLIPALAALAAFLMGAGVVARGWGSGARG